MQTLENRMRAHGHATDDDAVETPEGDAPGRAVDASGPPEPTLVTKPTV